MRRIPFILSLGLALLSGACQSGKRVQWIQTTEDAAWVEMESLILSVEPEPGSHIVHVDVNTHQQTIDGFGACFNELGWEALQLVGEGEREKIIRNLFDPDTGCRFSICRMPMGANDYAVDWYSHNEHVGDFDMKHFSISRDHERLIPYIRAAREVNPGFRLWASPWCPPSWMKDNGHYACSSQEGVNDLPPGKQGREMQTQFIMEPPVLEAYASYFSSFLKAYREEGIPIYAVHVQNEPNSCQNFPSCIWRPEDLATFIGAYLGPQFEKDGIHADIWLGTIERPHIERVDAVLKDEQASEYVKGVGFQWAGKEVIPMVQKGYPDLPLMQTESECGNGSNDWDAMEYTYSLMKHYFTHGVETYLYWNMVLDESGKSQWGWKQNSLITIDPGGQVTYNPEYYLMKHLSSQVDHGAVFIGALEVVKDCMAFMNPGGEVVMLLLNPEEQARKVSYEVQDGLFLNVELPASSLHTLKFML